MDEAIFVYSRSDWPQPPMQRVTYRSYERPADLVPRYSGYLLNEGYVKLNKKGFMLGGDVYARPGVEFEIAVEDLPFSGSAVSAVELYWHRIDVSDSAWQE